MSEKTITRFPAGDVQIPSSKSFGHRALLLAGLAALSGTESLIKGLSPSADIQATLSCVQGLGVCCTPSPAGLLVQKGKQAPARAFHCGESGSTLRFILPIVCMQPGVFHFTGEGRLLSRPMDTYLRIFSEQGLAFYQDEIGIRAQGPLPGGSYGLPGNVSSQFVSGLLMALPLSGCRSHIHLSSPLESAPYVRMTIDAMAHFGVVVEETGDGFCIPGGQRYSGCEYTIEGDYSQAAFFLAAGALGKPTRLTNMNPKSIQGDRQFVDILRRMGGFIEEDGTRLRALPSKLAAIRQDLSAIPDLAPAMAVLCCFANGTSHLSGAGRLRLKESDRLHALQAELHALGANITQAGDSLIIEGKPNLAGGRVDAHGDHRIAMALAVAAIGCHAPVVLSGWEHVSKSYPEFWNDFEVEGS